MVPSGATNYSIRSPYPDVLVRGRANSTAMTLERDGSIVVPVSGTFTLYNPAGTAVVDAAAVTTSSTLSATYSIPAASLPTTLTPLGDGWREVWALVMTVGADPELFERDAALARINLRPTVSHGNILAVKPTWSRSLGTQITSFQSWIDRAWGKIVRRLIKDGHIPFLIRSPGALHDALFELACAEICRGVKPLGSESTWEADALYHEKSYESAYTGTNFTVDYDHDGVVDNAAERSRARGILNPSGAPPFRGVMVGLR